MVNMVGVKPETGRFRIVVDNRAVMLIYGNSKSKPQARIERSGTELLLARVVPW
jgi:hypothetical protein